MYATGFSMQADSVAEQPGGPNERFLLEQAERHGAWLVGSIAQWSGPAGDPLAANVAVLAGPGGEVHRYDKIHPFSYAGEHEHYRAGKDFLTVDIDGLRVSVFICYDLRFADEFWALAPDTDLYVVPANWPQPRYEHWRALLRARAIENQAYVLGRATGSARPTGSATGATRRSSTRWARRWPRPATPRRCCASRWTRPRCAGSASASRSSPTADEPTADEPTPSVVQRRSRAW